MCDHLLPQAQNKAMGALETAELMQDISEELQLLAQCNHYQHHLVGVGVWGGFGAAGRSAGVTK